MSLLHRIVPLVVAAAASGLLAAPAMGQTRFPPAISVTGEASIAVPPDRAQLNAGVASEGKTARDASRANNAVMARVLQALKGAGVPDKDVQTSNISLQPEYAPNRNGPAPIVGYRASNRVTIKLQDVNKVADIIDTLVKAGANDIGNVGFSVSQASRLRDEAREKALADARRKAEIYAKAAGVTLGAPLSITEGRRPAPLFRPRVMAAAPMATSTPVAQGEETLSATVAVSWAIKPAQ